MRIIYQSDPKPFRPIEDLKGAASEFFDRLRNYRNSDKIKQENEKSNNVVLKENGIKCWCEVIEQNQLDNKFCCIMMENNCSTSYIDVMCVLLLLLLYFKLK